MPTVLITGVSGYVGSWCTHVALEAGYDVVGTVRDPASVKCGFLRDAMEGKSGKMSAKAAGHLTLVKADLLSGDAAWDKVFSGHRIDSVMHTASPYFGKEPSDESEYIRPAVEGTRSVVQAAIKHGVKRVVFTSTVGTMWFPIIDGKTYTAESWSEIEGNSAYGKSKTLAEQTAWKLVQGSSVGLTTIHPMFITGPTLYTDSTLIRGFESGDLVVRIMQAMFPMIPNIRMGLSDVRDVAKAHLLALEKPEAANQRFICCGEIRPFPEIIELFSKEKPELKIPVKAMPRWLIRFGALFSVPMKRAKASVDKEFSVDLSPMRDKLGLEMRPATETVADMMNDFIQIGAVVLPGPPVLSEKKRWRICL
jgi:dihydroflavonol-4-reductase